MHILENTQEPSSSTTRISLQSELATMLKSSSENEDDLTRHENFDRIIKSPVKSYLGEKRIDIAQSPVQWGEFNFKRYDCISALSRKFFSPPPASVLSK